MFIWLIRLGYVYVYLLIKQGEYLFLICNLPEDGCFYLVYRLGDVYFYLVY